MGDYDSYNVYLSITPSTHNEYYNELQQETLNDLFDVASNIYSVQHINYVANTTTTVNARVSTPYRIKSNMNLNSEDYKKFIFKNLNYQANMGDTFVYDSVNWLVIEVSKNVIICRRCNSNLKWKVNTTTYSYPCIISKVNVGLEDTKLNLILPNENYYVYVTKITNTKNIKLKQRFIFNDQVYEVTGIDEITINGLIQFNVAVTNKNNKDDFNSIIADNDQLNNGGGLW